MESGQTKGERESLRLRECKMVKLQNRKREREEKRKHESVGAGEEKEPFLFWPDVFMESWTFPLGVW